MLSGMASYCNDGADVSAGEKYNILSNETTAQDLNKMWNIRSSFVSSYNCSRFSYSDMS